MLISNYSKTSYNFSTRSFWLIFAFSLVCISAVFAEDQRAFIRQVRSFESDKIDIRNPSGLAFSPNTNILYVLPQNQPYDQAAEIFRLTLTEDRIGSAGIAAQIKDPINMAFDGRFNRLLILRSPANQLVEVLEDADGNLDPRTMIRHDVRHFGLQDPQGMAVDPASGVLFILDAAVPRILRIEPEADGRFAKAEIATEELSSNDLVDPRGLAFDPSSGHLHVVNPAEQELYELSQGGQVLSTRNLSAHGFGKLQGMVFAPSGDQTDDPLEMSLYLADSSTELNAGAQSSGQIVEMSFTALAASAASSFTSSLVNTVDMSQWSPPSPDPSGLAYIGSSNHLIMDDGEVEETVNNITHFQGANVWEMTLSGEVVDTANISKVDPTVVPMTNEPTGIAWNPSNGHFYVTQDDGDAVFDWDIGGDGAIGTSDDSWTSFSTVNGDPEGIAYDTWNNRLFVADGVDMEVYEYTLSGNLVNQFDVEQYGVADPESVEFNPDTGTLFVMSSNRSSPVIVETTTSGDLLQTIDITAAGARTAAGMAYAPASDGSGAQRFYIVDRGIDNNSDPQIIDGKMYELTAPQPITPGNLPPSVDAGPDQTITLPDDAILDGTVSDDGIPDPPGAVTSSWSQVSGPGEVTFGDASALDTTASFSIAGSYVLRLTASDGEFTPSDEVIITVEPDPSMPVVEVRVAANSDDAEEDASGLMDLGSSDLELVYDHSNQTVGMRFNGIDIPQGSTITWAYVQFQVDETDSEATDLIIEGEASDNATTFVSSNGNISSRPRTTASAAWSPPPWMSIGEAGYDQRTPDIAPVIQEIVDRPGWASGNSLAIIITGTGHRTAESYNGDPSGAPLLHVEYEIGLSNIAPQFTSTPVTTASEGALYTYNITASDPDAGDTLTITATTSPAWLTLTDNGNGTATLSGTPSVAEVGDHPVVLRVADTGGLFDTQSFNINVSAVNDAPQFTSTPVTTASEGALYTYNITASDPDTGDTLTITATTAPAWLFLADNGNGTATLSGTPSVAEVGDHPVVLRVADTGGLFDTQSFNINVSAVNDAPQFTSTPVTTASEGALYTYNITASDPDTGDTLTITATTSPAWLLLTDNGNGTATLSGTPSVAEVGDHPVVLRVADTGGLFDTQSFNINVSAVFCDGDFDQDGDIDGMDLFELIQSGGVSPADFAANFGRAVCP